MKSTTILLVVLVALVAFVSPSRIPNRAQIQLNDHTRGEIISREINAHGYTSSGVPYKKHLGHMAFANGTRMEYSDDAYSQDSSHHADGKSSRALAERAESVGPVEALLNLLGACGPSNNGGTLSVNLNTPIRKGGPFTLQATLTIANNNRLLGSLVVRFNHTFINITSITVTAPLLSVVYVVQDDAVGISKYEITGLGTLLPGATVTVTLNGVANDYIPFANGGKNILTTLRFEWQSLLNIIGSCRAQVTNNVFVTGNFLALTSSWVSLPPPLGDPVTPAYQLSPLETAQIRFTLAVRPGYGDDLIFTVSLGGNVIVTQPEIDFVSIDPQLIYIENDPLINFIQVRAVPQLNLGASPFSVSFKFDKLINPVNSVSSVLNFVFTLTFQYIRIDIPCGQSTFGTISHQTNSHMFGFFSAWVTIPNTITLPGAVAAFCTDQLPCQSGSCGSTQCIYTPNSGADCTPTDAVFCDGTFLCDGQGTCINSVRDCNDQIPCTTDTCNSDINQCVHATNTSNCVSEDPCLVPSCSVSGQCVFTPYDCGSTGNQCTLKQCISDPYNPGSPMCVTVNRDNTTSCTSSNPCNVQNGFCSGGSCMSPPIVCDDGLFCNGVETCSGGVCVSGTPPVCNDQIACTVDTCSNIANNCSHVQNPLVGTNCTVSGQVGACAFGVVACSNIFPGTQCLSLGSSIEICGDLIDNDCDGFVDETCGTINCITSLDCISLSDQCNLPICDISGVCVVTPLTGPCDDGNPCSLSSSCFNGVCLSNTTLGLDDTLNNPCLVELNPCAQSQCIPTSSLTYTCNTTVLTGNPCDTGSLCVENGQCTEEATCQGIPKVCADGSICTLDFCNEFNGECVHQSLLGSPCTTNSTCLTGGICGGDLICQEEPLTPPISLNQCTAFVCDPLAVDPQNPFIEVDLNDGTPCIVPDNLCMQNATCQSGQCVPMELDCSGFSEQDISPLSAECIFYTCEKTLGICVRNYRNNTTSCDAGLPCVVNGMCSDNFPGVCSGELKDCSTAVVDSQCQVPMCDPNSGDCFAIDLEAPCNDTNACTILDTCTSGICIGQDLECEDGLICNGISVCDNGMCVTDPGTVPNCTSGILPCQISTCNETLQGCWIRPPSFVGEVCGVTNEGACSTGNLICDDLTGEPVCVGNVDPQPFELCGQIAHQDCLCSDVPQNASRCVSFGIATSYTVITNSGISVTGLDTSAISGNVALSPATSDYITGPQLVIIGTTEAASTASMFAMEDVSYAYIFAFGQVCDTNRPPNVNNVVFTPGVYCFEFGASLSGVITFDGQGDPNASWIFKVVGSLESDEALFLLINEASLCNIHWFTGSALIIASGFPGDLISLGDVTLTEGTLVTGKVASIQGRLLMDQSGVLNGGCPEQCANQTICSQLANNDIDGDNINDCDDQCPTDPQMTIEGNCGCFSQSLIAESNPEYCTNVYSNRDEFGRGDGLDNNCNGVVDEGCGSGNCVTDSDCPDVVCHQAVCAIGNTCVYIPIEGSCPVSADCALPYGECILGRCQEIPVECTYDQGEDGPWDSQCIQSVCAFDGGIDTCYHIPLTGTTCTTDNLCLINPVCDQGFCTGPSFPCFDSNECTTDACNNSTGLCEFTNNQGSCQTENPCVSPGTCSEGSCTPGSPIICDDSNQCTTDSCLPLGNTYLCINQPVVSPNITCTTGSTECFPFGGCLPGTGLCLLQEKSCDSLLLTIPQKNVPCYNPICDTETGDCGLEFADGTLCNDTNACTFGDICLSGICSGTDLPDPFYQIVNDPHSNCSISTCDTQTGLWSLLPSQTGVCDDSDECTLNACLSTECVVLSTTNCADDSFCNGAERCNSTTGTCDPGVTVECSELDGNLCTVPQCSEIYDACIEVIKPGVFVVCGNATLGICSRGITECDPETGEIYCSGAIFPEPTDQCDGVDNNCNGVVDEGCGVTCVTDEDCPQVPCSDAECSLPSHLCIYIPNDNLTCSDNLFCTTNNHCSAGACVSDPIIPEPDVNPCVTRVCIEGDPGVIISTNVSYGVGTCDDNDLCTPFSFCDGEGGCTGPQINCNDFNVCTDDSCDSESGTCANTPLPGNNCTIVISSFLIVGICNPSGSCDPVPDPCVLNNTCPDCIPDVPNDSQYLPQCITGAYDPILRICIYDEAQNGSACIYYDDLCYNNSTCMGGECVTNGTRRQCETLECMQSYCNALNGGCEYIPTPGDQCNDGLDYTENDTCSLTNCCVGTNKTCDDFNICTDNVLDITGACIYVPNNLVVNTGNACQICTCSSVEPSVLSCVDVVCSNGIYCDGEETCNPDIGCQYSSPVSCDDDDDFCSTGRCNEEIDSCEYTPLDIIGAECGLTDEGECQYGEFACSQQLGVYCDGAIYPETFDLCDGLDRNCDGFVNTTCPDNFCQDNLDCYYYGVPICKQAICLSNNTCAQYPITGPCQPDVTDPCVEEYECTFGLCLPGVYKDCPLPDNYAPECVNSFCANDTGECYIEVLDSEHALIPCEFENDDFDGYCCDGGCCPIPHNCDDGNECTEDIFNPLCPPYCVHIPIIGIPCQNGDHCLINATCSSDATCEGISRNELPFELGGCYDSESDICKESVCVSVGTYPEYECRSVFIREGHNCNDRLECTFHDHCHHGLCVGYPKDCSTDLDNIILPYDDDDDDDDSFVRNWDPQCMSAQCSEENSGMCQIQYHEGACDDGLFCTTCEYCIEGECTGGEPRQCLYDPIEHYQYDPECIYQTCNEYARNCDIHFKSGNCTTVDPCDTHAECKYGRCEPVKKLCDDGDPCNGIETCSHGECITGTRNDCEDHNKCTIKYCDKFSGNCIVEYLPQIGRDCGYPSNIGECKTGTLLCNPYSGLYCNGSVVALPQEDCGPDGAGNGKDDNCDGYIDEGCTPQCLRDSDCYYLNYNVPECVVPICAQNMSCVYIDTCCYDYDDDESSSSSSSSSYSLYDGYDYYTSNSTSTDGYYYNGTSSSSSSSSMSFITEILTSLFSSFFADDDDGYTSYYSSYYDNSTYYYSSLFTSWSELYTSASKLHTSWFHDDDDDDGNAKMMVNPAFTQFVAVRNNQQDNIIGHSSRHSRPDDDDSEHSSSSSDHSESTEMHQEDDDDRNSHSDHSSSSVDIHTDDDDDHHRRRRRPSCSPAPSQIVHKTCYNGWVDTQSEYPDEVCQCKFGWTGEYCDECIESLGNEDYVLMCEKQSIGNMLHAGNAYELVFIHREILFEYMQITSSSHSTTSSSSTSSTGETNDDDQDEIPDTVFIDTSDITHEELGLRTVSTSSSSSDSSSRNIQDDEHDEHSNHPKHYRHHSGRHHSGNEDHHQTLHNDDEQSSSSSSSHVSDSEHHSHRHSAHGHNNHGHHDDDDDNYSKFVKPGTKGLSCTCEIEGEQPIYDIDPLARCSIQHVEQVMHSKEHHFNHTLSVIWRSVLILFVLIFAIVTCIIACSVCFSPRNIKDRYGAYRSLIPVYAEQVTKKKSKTTKKSTNRISEDDESVEMVY